MMKYGAIEFDDRILDALRDDRLVIFAGAGVSMGPPSNLASFWELASAIAQGTGKAPTEKVPLDRFLGQLVHRGIDVHERAAKLLSPEGSVPKALHQDLLRLFRTADRVRLVTTNFDLHFETAASQLFGSVPEVNRAPALPLGHDFSGIVHVHGALPQTRNLVLTDADFGRAYLTEGWARRFLVDVFRQYTVLFVGYSHKDVVMTYLARALPPDSVSSRFALTEEDGDWELLGIKPIRFVKGQGADAFKELDDGVHQLAERSSRGALDWQSRLAELGSRKPPIDPESISEIEQALREVYTTRLLLDVARDTEWIRWLSDRKQFVALFGNDELNERDRLFANWIAKHFAIENPHELLTVVADHGLRLNPELWWNIGRELGATAEKPMDESALKRLANVMLTCAPVHSHQFVLKWLAERCSNQGLVQLAVTAFIAMSRHRADVRPGYASPDDEGNESRRLVADFPIHADHWSLNEVWTKHVKPHLAKISQPLLSGVTRQLEELHGDLSAWDRVSSDWDPLSIRRSAIEVHQQNRHPEAIDVLVDAARDALEWLASNSPALLESWIERLVTSDVALLRRLAVHAMTVHPERTPEERLKWVLDRVGLYASSEHHEVYRAVASNYPTAHEMARKDVIDAILAHKVPGWEGQSHDMITSRSHYDWLAWLLKADPDCVLADAALATITAQYPDWEPSDHPEFTLWIGQVGWVTPESPWSVAQLMDREPREQIDDLLSFRGNRFDGPSRDGLLANVRDACTQDSRWAFALGQTLTGQALWSSDLWPPLIRGLQESELPVEGWCDLLAVVSNPELWAKHAHEIANLLYALVRDGGKPFSLELLEQANAIALPLWQSLDAKTQDELVDDWLTRAINRPAGVIVEFWINGLSLIMRSKTRSERLMPEHYFEWFTMVVRDTTTKGGMARSLLASQSAFLISVDEAWTRDHIIPLFCDPDPQMFAQAWDGFLVWGSLNPELADALRPAFVDAIPRLPIDRNDRRRRFMDFYTDLAIFYVSDPIESLLPALFGKGSLEDRLAFASHLGFVLRHMQNESKLPLWSRWLHRYWQNRLQGVPAALDGCEIREMLDWLPHLGDAFPEAVSLAIRSQPIKIDQCLVLYELQESESVIRHPHKTAELLIFFAECGIGSHLSYLQKIDSRLPPLPEQLRQKVNEAFARAGVPKSRD